MESVEDLKLLSEREFESLFKNHKKIVQRKARIAFKQLGEAETFNFQNASNAIPIADTTPPAAKKTKTCTGNPHVPRPGGKLRTIKECSAFPLEILKTKEEVRAEREEKRGKRKNPETVCIEDAEDDTDDNVEDVPTTTEDLRSETKR